MCKGINFGNFEGGFPQPLRGLTNSPYGYLTTAHPSVMSTKRGRKGFSNPAESQAHVSNGIHPLTTSWRRRRFFFSANNGQKVTKPGWMTGSTNPTDLPILPAFPPRVSEKGGMLRCHSIEWKDLENKLLLISINITPKTSHSCQKLWYTMLSRDHFLSISCRTNSEWICRCSMFGVFVCVFW